MCPIFVGSELSCFARYQKILWKSLLGCKNLLNFTCHTIKFDNCHHSTTYANFYPYVYKPLSSIFLSSLCKAAEMIVAKTLQVIWGLILIGTFNCGNGYSIPIIKIIPFPALKPAFKVQRIAEISTKVLYDPILITI